MVIETFRNGAGPVYARLAERGRMLPDGLVFVESWLAQDGARCWQLMETDAPALFQEWTGRWSDLVEFEIVALGEKPAALGAMKSHLSGGAVSSHPRG